MQNRKQLKHDFFFFSFWLMASFCLWYSPISQVIFKSLLDVFVPVLNLWILDSSRVLCLFSFTFFLANFIPSHDFKYFTLRSIAFYFHISTWKSFKYFKFNFNMDNTETLIECQNLLLSHSLLLYLKPNLQISKFSNPVLFLSSSLSLSCIVS